MRNIAIILIFLTTFCFSAMGEPTSDIQNQPKSPEAVKIGDNLYKIGRISVDMKKREVTILGWVNMSAGLIEYLACCAGGKLHESMLVLDTKPIHLQVALILIGLEPRGDFKFQGDPGKPKGDPVEIWVQWKNGEETKNIRAEQMIFDGKRNEPMPETQWIFTGSAIYQGRFVAEIEKSLIATYHDPAAIINNPLPEGADDTVYSVNSKLVPSKGTPIVLTIRAAGELKGNSALQSEAGLSVNKGQDAKILFQENFDKNVLDISKWVETKDGEFKELAIQVVPGEKNDFRLRLMTNTIGASDSVKSIGISSKEKIDFSKMKEISFDLDWNEQKNGCYLTAGFYICPAESQNPKKEEDWVGFEWIGVPPGTNIRNSVWSDTDGTLRELYTDWGPSDKNGKPQGWQVKSGNHRIQVLLDSKTIRVWADSKELCYAQYSLNFNSGYLYFQLSSNTDYPPREVYFDNIIVTEQ